MRGDPKSQPQDHSRGWRVGLGTTLALAMGVGPLGLYALSALSPHVIAELHLTRTQFGGLVTLSFVISALLSVGSGVLIDRVGGRRVLLLLFVTGGIAIIAVAVAPTYPWLLVAVAATGVAGALSNPVTNQVVAALIKPGRRGLLMGIKQSGVQLGQFLTGLTLPAAAAIVGWRTATSTSVILAIAGVALVVTIVPVQRSAAGSHGTTAADHDPVPMGVWWLAAYSLLMGAALQATNVYLPLYAYEVVGLTPVIAGATTGVMGGVGLMARVGWGRLTEYLTTASGALTFLALGATAGVVCLAAAAAGFSALLWVGITIHAATVMASNVVVMMAVVALVPVSQVGRASGILAVGMYIGFAAGPVSFGALADASGTYTPGWMILAGVYLLAAGLILAWVRQSATTPAASQSRKGAVSADSRTK